MIDTLPSNEITDIPEIKDLSTIPGIEDEDNPLNIIKARMYVNNALKQINTAIESGEITESIYTFFEQGKDTKIIGLSNEKNLETFIKNKEFDFLKIDDIVQHPDTDTLEISILAYNVIDKNTTKETLFTTSISIPIHDDDVYTMWDRIQYNKPRTIENNQ